MSELIGFAEKLLEYEGGLVEVRSGLLEAVIPASLSAQLKLPEHVLLSEDQLPYARRIGYGTELLDHLVELATSRVPVAFSRWRVGPIKEAAVRRSVEEFVLRNGVVVPGGLRPLTARRLWLHTAFALQSDERREGLTSAVVCSKARSRLTVLIRSPMARLRPDRCVSWLQSPRRGQLAPRSASVPLGLSKARRFSGKEWSDDTSAIANDWQRILPTWRRS